MHYFERSYAVTLLLYVGAVCVAVTGISFSQSY